MIFTLYKRARYTGTGKSTNSVCTVNIRGNCLMHCLKEVPQHESKRSAFSGVRAEFPRPVLKSVPCASFKPFFFFFYKSSVH